MQVLDYIYGSPEVMEPSELRRRGNRYVVEKMKNMDPPTTRTV